MELHHHHIINDHEIDAVFFQSAINIMSKKTYVVFLGTPPGYLPQCIASF